MKDKKILVNKQTSGLIAKNVIIFIVLIAVCSLSIWAWFTQNTTATADGINIVSKAEGVKVSWDGKDYYDNLTALESSGVVAGQTGLAKNICNEDGTPFSLNLISGNGLNFFEPYLNRRTGTVLTNSDSSWQGFDVTGSPQGKYIDIDLHFRSESQRDVYLAGDSKIDPKSTTDRISDFGPFSKDYIAAASRVAFLSADKKNVSFIWAPNANVELVENENGYTKVTDFDTAGGGTSAGDLGDVIDFTTENGSYYLWIPDNYSSDPNTQASELTAKKMNFTVYDKTNNSGLYTCEYTITEPNTGSNPTIIYYINENASSWNSDDISYVDISKSKANNDTTDLYPKVALADTFNLNNTSTQTDRKAPAFYIEGFKSQEIKITIGYNPVTKEVVVVGYSSTGTQNKTYNRAGDATDEVNFYELENGVTCALVNPKDGVAVSSGEHNKKAIQFKDTSKLNVLPISITTAEQFSAVKTGDGYSATYKFMNTATGTYLTVNNGEISYTAAGSAFSLYYSSEFEGPILKSGDYYLVVDGGDVTAVKSSELETAEAVTVYTGSSYQLNTNLTSDGQPYQYYNAETNKLITLGANSTPKLFASTQSTAETVKVGNTKIATLTKAKETDEFYTAHIVMRVWVEGTDREAKTPLADGVFDMSLHFISQ